MGAESWMNYKKKKESERALTFCLVLQMFSTSVMRAVLRWCKAFSSSSNVLLISVTASFFRSVSCFEISFTSSMAAVSWGSLPEKKQRRWTHNNTFKLTFFIFPIYLRSSKCNHILDYGLKLGKTYLLRTASSWFFSADLCCSSTSLRGTVTCSLCSPSVHSRHMAVSHDSQ